MILKLPSIRSDQQIYGAQLILDKRWNPMINLPKLITVFDTETTGTGRDALVVSYGSVELDLQTNKISEHFEIFVNPRLDSEDLAIYEEYAYKVTNISIPGMPDCDQTRFVESHIFTQEIQNRLKNTTSMLAHNASFDRRMLDQTLSSDQTFVEAFNINLFCSLKLSREVFSKDVVGSFSLDSLCKYTNVDISDRNFHGALLDAELTANYLVELNKRGFINVQP
ncbi:exonuclease domain-containing protein [Paracoccaceae bacterium]|nr:exonuclease domain-containing protein [Paracoccaceae bacterium]